MAYARYKANACRLTGDSADFDWLSAVQPAAVPSANSRNMAQPEEVSLGDNLASLPIWQDRGRLTTMVVANGALWLVLGAYFAGA